MQYFYYLCGEFMDKKTLYHIIEWVVAIAACVWLVYKLATYDDYAGLWAAVSGMDGLAICALLLCVVLMPLNMTLEAWRWRTLVPMSWKEAHRQVYYSKLAGLITPWRLGEYPARGLLMSEGVNELKNEEDIWPKVLSMGAVGSATMTFAIILAGVPAIMANGEWLMVNGEWWIAVVAAVILLTVGLVMAPRLLKRWATVSHRLVMVSVGQSLVRLACWCVQLTLVLYALGAILDFRFLIFDLPIYYLLVTITPNVPIAEVGVRGAWAMVVFGTMNAALAGVLLWVINTLLPCLIWPFLRKNE
jgi:hypothetical protein